MGIISLKDGYAVRFYYKDCFGNRQRKYKAGFPTKRKAELWEYQEKEKLEGIAPSTELSLSSFIDKFFIKNRQDKNVSISTLKKYQTYLPTIKQLIGHFEFQKITEGQCQAIINKFKDTPATAHEYKKILNAIFNYGKKRKLIRENPMEFVEVPRYQVKKIEPYSFETSAELFSTLKSKNSKLYTPCLLATLFSITREEACALLDSDLNDSDYSITVNKAIVDGLGIKETKEQKTENRQRVLYANKEIFDELRWFKRFNSIDSEFLCCNRNGTQIQPNTLSTAFPQFLRKNKLRPITFHGLRHTFSNLCKKSGIDGDTIYRMMGHSRYTTTVENYNSSDPELMQRASTLLFNKTQLK